MLVADLLFAVGSALILGGAGFVAWGLTRDRRRRDWPRWLVMVDDPDMDSNHRVEVVAPSMMEARLEAARRAILADRFGCGWRGANEGHGFPDGADPATFAMPMRYRRRHARDPRLVRAVASHATVTRA